MRNAALLAVAALLTICGCKSGAGGGTLRSVNYLPPRDSQETLARLNRNIDRIEGAVTAPATVSVSFRDNQGKARSINGYDATLIFDRPRCLYLNIKHPLAGSIARLGSNDERYWLTVDFEDNHNLVWGTWAALESGQARPLAVPPDRLLQTLLFQPIDDRLPGGMPPQLVEEYGQKVLLFQRRNPSGWVYVARRMRLSNQAPFLPVEINDYLSDGTVVMTARLSDHQPISGTTDTWTARSFRIQWPVEEASMTLRLQDVRYREKDYPFCTFPEDWSGSVERLDLTPDARSGP